MNVSFLRLRSWSLRARLTLAATALLGAGLALAGALLATTVARSLQAALDAGALQRGREVAALADTGRPLPDPLPVGGAATAVVQVVDARDRVRAGSAGADRLVGLLRPDELARARAGARLSIDGSRASLDGPLRVVAVPAGSPRDPLTVVVAVGSASVQESVRLLRAGLLLDVPVLLGLLALVSWRVIGWTLRPVEALRRGAEVITGAGVSRRLPLPAARDEVHRLAVTLNEMLARLESASERQRAFVSDAAHELRSPLASIRTQLEVAIRLAEPAGALARVPAPGPAGRPAARSALRPPNPANPARPADAPASQASPTGPTSPNDTKRPASPNDTSDPTSPNGTASQDGASHPANPNDADGASDPTNPNGADGMAGQEGASGSAGIVDLARDVLVDVDRLSRLVDDLLLLARLDEAAPSRALRRREPVDLRALAGDLAGRYDGARVPVTVQSTEPDRAPTVVGDPDGLRRVLANLLDNAVRHAASGVTVRVACTADAAELAVTDDGPGVPAADRDLVFDRFTRLDSARARDDDGGGGAGLGLAIVRELVRAHGGTAVLQDAEPGTRAVVTLPVAPPRSGPDRPALPPP